MIDFSADHVSYVLAAYAIVALVLAGVLVRTVLKAKSLKAALHEMNVADTGQRD